MSPDQINESLGMMNLANKVMTAPTTPLSEAPEEIIQPKPWGVQDSPTLEWKVGNRMETTSGCIVTVTKVEDFNTPYFDIRRTVAEAVTDYGHVVYYYRDGNVLVSGSALSVKYDDRKPNRGKTIASLERERDALRLEATRLKEDSNIQALTIKRLGDAAEDRNVVDANRQKMHEQEVAELQSENADLSANLEE